MFEKKDLFYIIRQIAVEASEPVSGSNFRNFISLPLHIRLAVCHISDLFFSWSLYYTLYSLDYGSDGRANELTD